MFLVYPIAAVTQQTLPLGRVRKSACCPYSAADAGATTSGVEFWPTESEQPTAEGCSC